MNTNSLLIAGGGLLLAATVGFAVISGGSDAAAVSPPVPDVTQFAFYFHPDLSDRMKHLNRAAKDNAVGLALWDVFRGEVQKKLHIASRDRLTVTPVPQTDNPSVFPYIDKLQIDMRQIPLKDKKDAIAQRAGGFEAVLGLLFQEAQNQDHYSGSDIWELFNSGLQVDSVDTNGQPIRTIVVITTDGYMVNTRVKQRVKNKTNYVPGVIRELRRPDWEQVYEEKGYGILSTDKHYPSLEVLVLGIEPTDHFGEFDRIHRYFSDWFKDMGIRRFEIHRSKDSIEEEQALLRDFVAGDAVAGGR